MQTIIKIKQGTPRKPEWCMAEPVDFELCEGEQLAIYGPNGSGKSMLTDIITGRHPLLHNQATYDFSPSTKPYVSDNIKLVTFRDSYGDSDASYYLQQRWNQQEIDPETPTVAQELKRAGAGEEELSMFVPAILHSPVILLSSGELRKFQLAKALLSRPRVLIIDNPYIGLDVQARKELTISLESLIATQPLQLILVVSRKEDIPRFVTHTIKVDNRHVGAKEKVTATDRPVILEFRDVTIRYGQRTILSHLNWKVSQGEHWALKGPNGSGKSTLLSLVCADNPQGYAADISLFGHRRGTGESIWDIKRHIGYVSPEMHRAYRHNIPAIDIVASGLKDTVGLYNRPTAEDREKCHKWLEQFHAAHLADKTFLQLSSGEQRLVLLARAFVKEPDLLILDEPLHGLDDANSQLAKEVIERYCSSTDKTLIMVTHYDSELPPCIDHTLTLKKNL